MQANLNAFGLLTVIMGSVAVLIVFGSPPSGGMARILLAIGLSVLCAGLSITVSLHKCLNGQPLTQWLLPTLCLALIVIFVRNPRIVGVAVIFLIISGMLLSIQYAKLVHNDDVIGVTTLPEAPTQPAWHSFFTHLYMRRSPGKN